MEFFTDPSFTPFAISSYVLAVLLSLELLMILTGLGGSSFLDDFLPDIPEPPADVLSLSAALYYFGIGQVPALMLVTIFSAFFSISGLIIQSLSINILGFPLPVWIAVAISIPSTLLFSRPVSMALGRVINSKKGHAPSTNSLIGRVATITDGTSTFTSSAAAQVRGPDDSLLDIYVKCAMENDQIAKGETGTIISYVDGFYLVVKPETNEN